jgi:hypothetical protein
MTEFLAGHFRYPTMNSWNRATSYACNLKVHRLGFESDVVDKLFNLIQTEEFHDEMNELKHEFGATHRFNWQAGMNGRSGGYLVLYQGAREPSGYKSYCTHCGQKNYKSITEGGNICGVCRNPSRVDFRQTHMRIVSYPGRGTDDCEDFTDWSLYELKNRVELVQSFDKLADAMVNMALWMAKNCDVREETYYTPQTRLTMTHAG